MAVDILNQFLLNNSNIAKSVNQASEQNNINSIDVKNAIRAIASLLPGQTIQGELVQKEGNNIQLLLQNNFILNTKLDQDLNLNMGQLITFEVKGNQNGQLVLRPLFENIGQDANVTKALEAAGIKETSQTINMVNELMNQGMPVNKEILLDVFRQSNRYPQADISDIIMLHKMQITVNENNISQMHLYQNNNQWMIENLSEFTDQLFNLMENMESLDTKENQAFINELDELLNEMKPNFQFSRLETNMNELKELSSNPINTTKDNSTDIKMIDFKTTDIEKKGSDLLEDQTSNSNRNIMQENSDVSNKNTFNIFNIINQIKKGSEGNLAALHKAVFDMIKSEFLLEPQKIDQKDYINRYYEKLSDVTSKLETLLKENGKSDTAFSKTVTQIKNNVNFLNQVNEVYHYVQLPLKMNDRHANGELHVFTKKRSQTSKDDNLTALLHLSMEYLGNIDIYLSLQGEHLNTRFCLEKEEMIDFIEEHIENLNLRLSGKGYITNTEVRKMDSSQNNVIKTILDEKNDMRLLSKQSFDARA